MGWRRQGRASDARATGWISRPSARPVKQRVLAAILRRSTYRTSTRRRVTRRSARVQVIAGTFDAYAGPFRHTGPFEYGVSVNPMANIYSALNYGEHGAGFGRGPGQIGSVHGYDSGGWWMMPGLNIAGFNGIGAPEPVLTPGQWDAMYAIAQGAARGPTSAQMERLIKTTAGVGQDVGAELSGTTRRAAIRGAHR